MNPFFSIVIPVYNRAEIIDSALDSVFNQEFGDYEVIVVNDGSTDNSIGVIREKFGNRERLRIIEQENKERGAARNTGFRSAKGKYVVFFDSDDLMHPDHLSVFKQKIDELNDADFIATRFEFMDENGRRFDSSMAKVKEGFHDYRMFLDGNPLACNVCVRRENANLVLFEEDRKYAIKEDWMFLLANTRNAPLYIIGRVTITMRDHAMRSMRSESGVMAARTFLAGEWIRKNVNLTSQDERRLNAHLHYFSAIHYYLENKRSESLKHVMKAISLAGFRIKYLALAAKTLLGRNIVSKLK